MNSLVNFEKLEELLIASWAEFISIPQFIAFVKENVINHEHAFTPSNDEIKNKGVQITLSRFTPTPPGYVLWAEFHVPIRQKIAVGTMELLLDHAGNLSHQYTLGNIFQNIISK